MAGKIINPLFFVHKLFSSFGYDMQITGCNYILTVEFLLVTNYMIKTYAKHIKDY